MMQQLDTSTIPLRPKMMYPLPRVGNCVFLVANATKKMALATRISQLVASGRLTISGYDD